MTAVAIDNLDSFKSWLTKTLTPICDADPQALAKYVIALIKKEKTAEELKPVCLNQLDVFLQEKTKDFVDTLFLSLKNKTYLPPPGTETKPTPPPSQTSDISARDNTAVVKDKENTNSDADNQSLKRLPDDLRNKLGVDERRRSRSPGRRSPLRGRNSRERSPIKDRSPIRDRNSARDRSPNRDRQSPFRRRTVFDRLDRRRSPERGSRPRYGGRYDPRRRRPSLPRSPGPKRSPAVRRSRSPRPRSPGPARPRSLSPERRRSVDRRSLSPRERQPRSRTPPRRFRPRSWSMSSSGLSSFDGSRSRSKTPPLKSPVTRSPARGNGKSPDSRGSTPRDYSPYNREPREIHDARDYATKPPAPPVRKPRCRDYDEKGFCMRGDLCPYDHGADPVVVDDISLPSVLQLNQGASGAPPRLTGPPPGAMGPQFMGPQGPMLPRGMPMRGPMVPRQPLAAGPLAGLPINVGRPPPPPPPPGYPVRSQAPALTPPPPPGTVPIRIPVVSQGYIPSQAVRHPPPPYNPEPYNPEAPSIRVAAAAPGYYPNPTGHPEQQLGPRVVQSYPMMITTSQPVRSVHGNLVTVPTQQPQQKVEVPTITEPDGHASTSNRTVLLGKRQVDESSSQNGASGESPSKKPMFDKDRLGPKRNYISNNCALELRKVPLDKNDIGSINAHFAKFGLITNLQVCYKGDAEAAVVTFATRNQAQAAYRCTEPIFNNRFVKVFWHSPDSEHFSEADKAAQRLSVKERLGTIIPPLSKMSLSNVKKPARKSPTVMPPTGLSKTVFNPDAVAEPQQVPHPTPAQKAKDDYARKIDYAQKKAEIQKKKHQLLQEQLKQQKCLISKLEDAKNMTPEDKKSILQTIKVLADSIEKLKSELLQKQRRQLEEKLTARAAKASNPQAAVPPTRPEVEKPTVTVDVNATPPATPEITHTPTSPEEKAIAYLQTKQKAQKAILDTELDIMNQQNSGADTSALRQRVADLKREAASLGLLGRGRGLTSPTIATVSPGRGGAFAGRGRSAYSLSHMIDRRPKLLHVTHYTREEKEEVVSHLSTFGAIESIVHDDSVPSMTIDFKTRQDAENAARDGQGFKAKRLVMSWHKFDSPAKSAKPSRSTSIELLQEQDGEDEEEQDAPTVTGSVSLGLDDPDLDGLDEDALLGLDDDDDDEDAEKSWKR